MKIDHKKLLGTLLFTSLFLACSPATATQENQERFKATSVSEEDMLEDTQTKLQWANGSNTKAEDGCKGFKKNPKNTEAYIHKAVIEHCENLNFGGHMDWRVPTAKENKVFIQAMHEEGKVPYYIILACPRVIGFQGDKVATTNTHNTKPIGEIYPWKIGNNGGLRCVRDVK